MDSDDFHGYVTLSHSVEGLIVKIASKSRGDIHIPLVPDQLKLLFDFLTSEGTDCLGTKSRRNYEKTGKFKSRGSKALASADDADDPSAGDSGED